MHRVWLLLAITLSLNSCSPQHNTELPPTDPTPADGTAVRQQFFPIVMAHVAAELDSLADQGLARAEAGDMKEQFRCLLGALSPGLDTLYIGGTWQPPFVWVAPDGIQPETECPPRVTLGTWHTHLPWSMYRTGPRPFGQLLIGARGPEENFCALSSQDSLATRYYRTRGVMVFIVAVSSHTRCGWIWAGDTLHELHWQTP
jgi:hypothetical protein